MKQIGKAEFQRRYTQLLGHFGLDGDMTNAYSPHENGDVEQRHHRIKRAIDQAPIDKTEKVSRQQEKSAWNFCHQALKAHFGSRNYPQLIPMT